MATFNFAMCHNLRPYKTNNNNGWLRSIFQENNHYNSKIFIMTHVRFLWIDESQC